MLVINNGSWTDWSATWNHMSDLKITQVVISDQNYVVLQYDFRPKLHDTKFNHFIISILKL